MLVGLKDYEQLNGSVGILKKINVDPEKPGMHHVYLPKLNKPKKMVRIHEKFLKCVSEQVTSK